MKKFVSFMLAAVLCFSVCSFAACSDNQANARDTAVMTVSLNPKVEFVLDSNDVVVAVNALNEEGNLIVSADVFVGKDKETAVQTFVQVSKETGFLVTGNVKAGENEINVSISGKDAQARYEEVKAKLDEYLSKEKIDATVAQAKEDINAFIDAQVAKVAPYLEAAEIKAMDYAEKIKMLMESAEETAKMYSEEVKNAYYRAKANAYEIAKFEYVAAHLDSVTATALRLTTKIYETACGAYETAYNSIFVSEKSAYQVSLAAFRIAKTNYLNYRNYVASLEQDKVTEAVTAALDAYGKALERAQADMTAAYNAAAEGMKDFRASMDTAYANVIDYIQKHDENAKQHIADASASATAAIDKYSAEFEKKYSETMDAAQKAWNDMKDKLEKGYDKENENK